MIPALNSSFMPGRSFSSTASHEAVDPTRGAAGRRRELELPLVHSPLHPELRSIAHGIALEILRAVSEELSAARDEIAEARAEAFRVGVALDELHGKFSGGAAAGSGGREPLPCKGVHSSTHDANRPSSAGSATYAVEADVVGPAITYAETACQDARAGTESEFGEDSIIEVQAVDTSDLPFVSFAKEACSAKAGHKIERSGRATLQMCSDLCAATETLAFIGVFMLGFVFEALVNIDDDDHPLTGIYTLALSCSASLSCFVVAFTVLERYYLQMTRCALSSTFGTEQLSSTGLSSFTFGTDFEIVLAGFQGLRAHVRNSVWASLCLILLAAVLRVCKRIGNGVAWGAMPLVSGAALCVGGFLVLTCVRRFRAAYSPLLRCMSGRV